MRKKLVYKIFGGLILFSLIYAVFLYLFYTSSGLQLAYKYGKLFIAGDLKIGGLSGELAGKVRADSIDYVSEQVKLSAHDAELEFEPFDLFLGKIKLNRLKAENVAISVFSPKKRVKNKDELTALSERLPKFDLQNISLQKITFTYPEALKTVNIDNLKLSVVGSSQHIDLINLQVLSSNINMQVNGRFDKQYALNWSVNIKDLNSIISNLMGDLNTKGSLFGSRLSQLKTDITLRVKNLKFMDNTATDLEGKFVTDADKSDITHINFSLGNLQMREKYAVNRIAASGELILNDRPAEALALRFSPITIYLLEGKKAKQTTINAIDLKVAHDSKNLTSDVSITPLAQSPIIGKLVVTKDRHLNGEFNWSSRNLQFLEILIPEIQKVVGKLDAVFTLQGTVKKPEWNGKLILQQFGANVSKLNLNLTNGQFNINVSPKEVQYNGQIFSGNNSLNVYGSTKLGMQNSSTEVNITGKNFLLTNIPSTRIYISPDLKLKIEGQRMELDGAVIVPEATILSYNLSDVETLPNDVIFTDQEQSKMSNNIVDFYSHINLILGDKIYLDTMGLKGNITGQVLIIGQPKTDPTGNGSLIMKQGSYSLYGQNLNIENGSLIFSNSPINNPTLSIRAFRTIKAVGSGTFNFHDSEKITVGVNIQGSLNNPQSSLYSEPSGLSQEDILSYLLLGQSSSQMNDTSTSSTSLDSQVNLMLNAIKTLNIGGSSNKITALSDNLRKKLGFSQFGLETEAIEDKTQKDSGKSSNLSATTSLVLGRYLSPSLYVGYSIGILDQVSIFKVSYKLWRGFIVQTETSSLGTGVDLLYSITRD